MRKTKKKSNKFNFDFQFLRGKNIKVIDNILKSEKPLGKFGIQFPLHKGKKFMFKDGKKFICLDNTDGDAYVEEFNTYKKAKKYLIGK